MIQEVPHGIWAKIHFGHKSGFGYNENAEEKTLFGFMGRKGLHNGVGSNEDVLVI